MPEAMRASVNSGRAIPSSWGSRPDGYDIDVYADLDEPYDDRDDDYADDRAESSASQHSESTTLVRQASLGKKARPTLTTITSADETSRVKKIDIGNAGVVGRAAVAAGAAGGAVAAGIGNRRQDQGTGMGNRTLMIDTSTGSRSSPNSSSETAGEVIQPVGVPWSRSPLTSPTDPEAAQFSILNDTRTSGLMSDRVPAQRRPPRLDIDAVKEAEARGSLTSLPDLIRRATRVAANLDRGKTASRLGIWDIMNAENNTSKSSEPGKSSADTKRRSGSISDILASFPPPALGTPNKERPISRWPSPFSSSNLNNVAYPDARGNEKERPGKKQARKCCGLPRWGFFLLLLLVFVLIAAAIIIPIVLIVLPRTRNANNASAAADKNSSGCASTNPCSNEGVSVTLNGQCGCVCVNGFTGSTCDTASDAACTTLNETIGSNGSQNVTLGTAIPRLFSTSSANFSIPLDTEDLLTLFSANNLSCTTENALVTFDGKSSKRFYISPEDSADVIYEHAVLEKREIEEVLILRRAGGSVATSDGIVYLASATTSGASTESTTATITESNLSESSSNSTTTSSGLTLTQDVLDFARIVVLVVFETTSDLSSAVVAQEKIQNFFSGTTDTSTSSNMSMGTTSANFTLNFSTFSITLSNGTVLGGNGDGSGGLVSNSTSNSKR